MAARYAIVVARFYEDLAARLEAGARAVFERGRRARSRSSRCPGAYELAAAAALRRRRAGASAASPAWAR